MSADATDRDAALADALEDVVRWRRCEEGLLPHRREPFLRERVWLPRGRWLQDGEAGRGTVLRVGLDALDRVRVVGPDRDPAGWAGTDVATVAWDGARSSVLLHDRAVDYEVDDAGRVVAARMTGRGESIAERYRRDDRGRVVWIEEDAGYSGWFHGVLPGDGPHFAVKHDEHGPLRVRHTASGEIRWERVERPFAELLAAGAQTLARAVVAGVERRAAQLGARGTEVYALLLLHFDQGNLRIDASFALETERRSWLGRGHDVELVERALLATVADEDEDSLEYVEVDWDEDLCWLLLREAALDGPDPYATVLDEVARVLARHDWEGLVAPSDDFVVYGANYDEDIPPKVRAIRAANPPARLAAWEAAFPGRGARADAYRDELTPEPDFVHR